jgi:regulator of sigma E protease
MVIEQVYINDVASDSPAQAAGIETGDILLKINDKEMKNRGMVGYYIQLNLGKPIDMALEKPDGSQKEVTVTPRWNPPAEEGATGIMIEGIDSKVETVSTPFWEAIPNSFTHSWEIMVLFRNEIAGWFVKGTAPQVSGPIGIAQLTNEFVKAGISPLIEFTGLISISLGIFNLLPFPGLDGGRIVFVILEWIRGGKRISAKSEGLIHTIGFILLIMLILVISYFDVMRLIQGESIIP